MSTADRHPQAGGGRTDNGRGAHSGGLLAENVGTELLAGYTRQAFDFAALANGNWSAPAYPMRDALFGDAKRPRHFGLIAEMQNCSLKGCHSDSLRYVYATRQLFVYPGSTAANYRLEMDDFRARLRSIRNSMGLSQAQFGELIGLGKQAVSAWEKGRNEPNVSKLQRMGEKLGYDANFWVHGDKPPVSPEAMRFAVAFDQATDSQKVLLRRIFSPAVPDDKLGGFANPPPEM